MKLQVLILSVILINGALGCFILPVARSPGKLESLEIFSNYFPWNTMSKCRVLSTTLILCLNDYKSSLLVQILWKESDHLAWIYCVVIYPKHTIGYLIFTESTSSVQSRSVLFLQPVSLKRKQSRNMGKPARVMRVLKVDRRSTLRSLFTRVYSLQLWKTWSSVLTKFCLKWTSWKTAIHFGMTTWKVWQKFGNWQER